MTTGLDLLARMTVPAEPEGTTRKSILLKGKPGTGKTWNALHCPGRTIVIAADPNRDTLLTAKAERPDDIIELEVRDWKNFDPGFINLVKNRELDCENIVIDSIDMLYAKLIDKIRGNKAKLGFDEWAEALNTQRRLTFELVEACRPQPDKRNYNLIATAHIQEQTNPEGGLISYETSIQGSFRSKIEAYFDFVLITDSEMKRDPTTKVVSNTTFIRTVKPNNYHTCKAPIHWPARVDSLEEIQKIISEEASTTK